MGTLQTVNTTQWMDGLDSIKTVTMNTSTNTYVGHSLKLPFVCLAKVVNVANLSQKQTEKHSNKS